MKKLSLGITLLLCLCVGALHAQTPTKGLTVTGAYDEMKTVEPTPRFVSPTGELYKRPVISISGQLLNASINITDNTITSCSTLALCATLTATVSGSGDYLIPISERGVCFSTTVNPTLLSGNKIADATMSSDGTGSFEILMTGLEPITTYHARAYVVCLDDTVYSSDMSFTTPKSYCHSSITLANETSDATGVYAVSDHEGNSYSVVQLGNQCWLRENLRTTTSPSTGNSIVVTSPNRSYNQKAAYWYNDDATTYSNSKYGLLYNWCAAVDTFDNNGTIEEVATTVGEILTWSPTLNVNAAGHRRGICPAGWHLPSREEWENLANYVKSQSIYQCDQVEDNIAKSLSATTDWQSATEDCSVGNNLNANNITGFSALPSGSYRSQRFESISVSESFWTTDQTGRSSFVSSLVNIQSIIRLSVYEDKYSGQSVRCVRDVILDLSSTATNNKAYTCGSTSASVTYTATPENGTAGYTYSWSPAGGVTSDGGRSYTISYNNVGSYSVTCTATQNGHSITNSLSTQVTKGDPFFTHGENKKTVTLSNFSCDAKPSTIVWEAGGSSQTVGNNTSLSHTYTANGTYTITATSASGCPYTVDVTIDDYMHADMSCAVSSRNTNETGYCNVVTGLTDYDGNGYAVVKIGSQCWIAQSLRVKHYPDGTAINQGNGMTSNKAWYNPPQGADQVAAYGLLYNWYTAMGSNSGNPGVCPTGWHVPTSNEVSTLINTVKNNTAWRCDGVEKNIANALSGKEGWGGTSGASTSCNCGYNKPTINATGFNALPSGTYTGQYNDKGYAFYFWTRSSSGYRNYRLGSYTDVQHDDHNQEYGFSVRCVRN